MPETISLAPLNSLVQVHNFFDPLPSFMAEADVLYSDPPWIKANITLFFNKAKLPVPEMSYFQFADIFLKRAFEIDPDFLFIEMGKESLSYWIEKLKRKYKYVTFYNSTYYKLQTNKCYVIQATNKAKDRRFKHLEDMDSDDILDWICKELPFACIGDFCMGLGMTGKTAHKYQRRFVGAELNEQRLQRLIKYIRTKNRKGKSETH